MELEKKVNDILKESLENNEKAFKNIANAEIILKQAYEGRYLFELIQNARDANKESGKDGKVEIKLEDHILTISNTGGEFSLQGIESITNIGDSTKHSQEFIGHKGIGFKSILEICRAPKIVTKDGSVFFSREESKKRRDELKGIELPNIPLFFFPHFDSETIEPDSGFVTRIEMPLKEDITPDRIVNDFENIQAEQLVLLGNLREVIFNGLNHPVSFHISENNNNHTVEVAKNDTCIKYKVYLHHIPIPKNILEQLDDKEKALFDDNSNIDIKILLKIDERNHFDSVEDAKLYLFYPLDITSGFQFLIHSYFIVNPERTALRENPLNNFLLEETGKYISTKLLTKLKKSYKTKLVEILRYKRLPDSKLDVLYDTVKSNLIDKKFLYDTISKRFYAPKEVIIADDFDKKLFTDGRLQRKRLIFLSNKDAIEWLKNEFSVEYLTYNKIADVIETECLRHKKTKNIQFFQNLYNYVNEHENLDLTGKKVLLTSDNKLVSSDDDVFYGGGSNKKFPETIRKHINFIHPDIKISDLRDGKSRTGIKEYSTYEVVRRVLDLFENKDVKNNEILEVLFSIELDKKSISETRKKIRLPVKGSNNWLSPLYKPIYFDKPELRELYPNGAFIDDSIISNINSYTSPNDLLKKVGVWDIPGVYIKHEKTTVEGDEPRDNLLYKYSGLFSRPFYIQNDRSIDRPEKITPWFTARIFKEWSRYYEFLNNYSNPSFRFRSRESSYREIPNEECWKYSGFISYLSVAKWVIPEPATSPLTAKEVVGISYREYNSSITQIIKKYLDLIAIDYEPSGELLDLISLPHIDGNDINDFKKILTITYKKYKDGVDDESDFIKFYNKLLHKLYAYVEHKSAFDDEHVKSSLINMILLAKNECSNTCEWIGANDIFYKDKSAFYRQLPNEIKKSLQPQFTNQDKNTFGRLASRIGKKISASVDKEMLDTPVTREIPIVEYARQLPEMLCLLESKFDLSLTDEEINKIKECVVKERNNIKIKVTIKEESIEPIISEEKFYTQNDKSLILNIVSDPLKDSNDLLAGAIACLCSTLLDRDLIKYHQELLHFIKAENSTEYLDDSEIDPARLEEVRSQIEEKQLDEKQSFYTNIFALKNITHDVNNLDKDIMAKKLGVGLDDLESFEKKFNFKKYRDPDNIIPLNDFFSILGISLSAFNKHSSLKLSYEEHHLEKLEQEKNKLEKNYESWLYEQLRSERKDQKSKYQELLDAYQSNNEFDINDDDLLIDYEKKLHKWLKEVSPAYNSKPEIIRECDIIKVREIYYKNKKSLIDALKDSGISEDCLDKFLSIKSVNSLLYFEYDLSLIDTYKDKFGKKLDKNKTEDEPSFDIDIYINKPDAEIRRINPEAISNDRGKTENKKKTIRRIDGGSASEDKEKIGLVAEKMVYELLSEKPDYSQIKWVSKNAAKANITPEGDDSHGYDIEYLDREGNKIYVEVKGKNNEEKVFIISMNELKTAFDKREKYRLIFVANTLDNESRDFIDLGDLFNFEPSQDFMKNDKFTPTSKTYEIKFNLPATKIKL